MLSLTYGPRGDHSGHVLQGHPWPVGNVEVGGGVQIDLNCQAQSRIGGSGDPMGSPESEVASTLTS